MGLEVGMIVEGKVTGITKFGAFVELDGGKTGMVHISEIAPTYVSNISDHLKENQTVKVMIQQRNRPVRKVMKIFQRTLELSRKNNV